MSEADTADRVEFEERTIELRRSPNDTPCPTKVIDIVRYTHGQRKVVGECHLLADLIPSPKI